MKSLQTLSIRKSVIFSVLIAALLVLCVMSVMLGAVSISPNEIFSLFSGKEIKASHRSIILFTRLPRTAACVLSGAALAVSGVVIQTVLDNPLSAPNIIGVNSGAGFFAVLSGVILPSTAVFRSLFAFIGALTAVFLVLLISEKSGASKMTLVLTGIAVSGIFTAGTEAVISFYPDSVSGYADFRIGGFSGVTAKGIFPSAVIIVISLLILLFLTNELDILSLGHNEAKSLGLNASLMRKIFLILSAALAGAAVSFSGIIGFVGLLVPHIMRRFVGSESRPLILSSVLGGACFMLFSDLVSRLLFRPYELPVGILLSFLGGPFFIFLILKQRKGRIHD